MATKDTKDTKDTKRGDAIDESIEREERESGFLLIPLYFGGRRVVHRLHEFLSITSNWGERSGLCRERGCR